MECYSHTSASPQSDAASKVSCQDRHCPCCSTSDLGQVVASIHIAIHTLCLHLVAIPAIALHCASPFLWNTSGAPPVTTSLSVSTSTSSLVEYLILLLSHGGYPALLLCERLLWQSLTRPCDSRRRTEDIQLCYPKSYEVEPQLGSNILRHGLTIWAPVPSVVLRCQTPLICEMEAIACTWPPVIIRDTTRRMAIDSGQGGNTLASGGQEGGSSRHARCRDTVRRCSPSLRLTAHVRLAGWACRLPRLRV
ncbi:hypothetical protein H920_07834 [Fukomys damarensis]|uniref:Uncharacterized protein n=1 Tax=Fukomys damarensis TaxID=885580 RepID=A0A091E6L0_FUKDA|nr:hypothetical protein H920_07834 [Fukomys damarensis]